MESDITGTLFMILLFNLMDSIAYMLKSQVSANKRLTKLLISAQQLNNQSRVNNKNLQCKIMQ